jgi:hypothetical protein
MIEAPAIALTVRIFWERQLRRSGPPPTSIDIPRAFAGRVSPALKTTHKVTLV